MSGYIGSRASVVSSGAERKQIVNVTSTTSTISGVAYTPGFVDVFHNGVRLTQDTDFTATNGSSISLTSSAESGDQIVVTTRATFSPADAVSKGGDTMTGDLTTSGKLQSATFSDGTITIDSDVVTNGTAKAWALCTGGGTVAIRDSYNITSMTDNGTGTYANSVTSAFGTINFAIAASGYFSNPAGAGGGDIVCAGATSASAYKFDNVLWSGSLRDIDTLSTSCFGDLA